MLKSQYNRSHILSFTSKYFEPTPFYFEPENFGWLLSDVDYLLASKPDSSNIFYI